MSNDIIPPPALFPILLMKYGPLLFLLVLCVILRGLQEQLSLPLIVDVILRLATVIFL